VQRYFSNIKEKNSFILNDDDWYHIRKVMRMTDDTLIEVVYKNNLYICKVKDKFAVIDKMVENENIKKVKYVLVVPLLPEQKMSFVLQKATELGVDEIIPIFTERSKVKIDEKEDKKLLRWNRICKEAAEQAKRLDIPKISRISNIKDINTNGLKIVCSTKEKSNSLKKVLKNNLNCDRIIMGVGPEGGLTDKEEQVFIEQGFIPVSLGSNIMRVETVPVYLLSVLNYELME